MPRPDAASVCELIEAGQISEAADLTESLSARHIYLDLIFLSANDNPSRNYLDFLLAVARRRSGTLSEIELIDYARALLVTALAPLDGAFEQAYELQLESIELKRSALERDIRDITFFKNTPDRELDGVTEEHLTRFADTLGRWRRDRAS